MGDETALRRLAGILIDNALKYTPAPGEIVLSLEPKEQSVVLTLRDSGVGIAAEDQARIFERFYRVDKARSRASGGAGLGLSIARWIAAFHHGSISVESSPGNGATFRVELPQLVSLSEAPQSGLQALQS
jgi:two-component system OmpR family sensor kinase